MNINLANMIDHVTWDLGHAPCSGEHYDTSSDSD